jgi:hypothetical protein
MSAFTATPLPKLKAYYDAAMSQFNEVTEQEHGRFALDAAIYTLNAAELRFRAAIQRDRSLFCPNGLDEVTNRGKEC